MKYLSCFFAFLLPVGVMAQGVRGSVYTQENEPLAYATIYIPSLETGTSTNQDGKYEIQLAPGRYELVFQHLGYITVVQSILVQDQYLELDVTLPDQAIQLKEVEVNARAEDPAYTIIRKAIAKRKFYNLQVQRYQARVYIKGAGRVKEIPWLLEKSMSEEDIDTSTVYLTESVSEVTFEQPNKLTERVISIRSTGDQNDTSPNAFINGSFYQPEVAGVISPLSSRAFAYYRFRYLGFFVDRGKVVNKIRVTPRSRGDNVFDGYIFIIDDLWNIHSLNMHTYKQGVKIGVEQIYAPIREQVWMPVSHQIQVGAKILGVAFEYNYLATISDYDITLNPDLKVEELLVIDEKIDKELAAALEADDQQGLKPLAADSSSLFAQQQKFTRKELRKTLRRYEREKDREDETPDVIAYRNMRIDSTAYQKDAAYWANTRPVPLSEMERESYQKLDSIALAKKKEAEEKSQNEVSGDNEERRNTGISGLIFGTTLDLGAHTSLEYKSFFGESGFNTVEGYHVGLPLILRTRLLERDFRLEPTLRYAFARQKALGKLDLFYTLGNHRIQVSGGQYVYQFNEGEPITPAVNTLTTLWQERNLMKLYQKGFGQLGWRYRFSEKFRLEAHLSWERREQLFNNTSHSWRDVEERAYSPNAPVSQSLANTAFPLHEALLFSLEGHLQPFLKYRVINGKKRVVNEQSPEFRWLYQRGTPNWLGSQVNYDQLELSVRHQVKLGARGSLGYHMFGGFFPNARSLFFMDYRHFMGNQTLLQVGDPLSSYRLLDYYRYSTAAGYAGGHAQYQFRRFLLTQIFEVQLLGIKENLLLNYLKTAQSPHYMEVGYSLDNILRFLRLEAVANFENGQYRSFGLRVGISTTLSTSSE